MGDDLDFVNNDTSDDDIDFIDIMPNVCGSCSVPIDLVDDGDESSQLEENRYPNQTYFYQILYPIL